MANKHSAKRKFIASMLVLCLCFSMLVGTTLAWFTDEVSSNNNVIQTGKLDVALYYADGEDAVPQDKDWTKVTDQAIFTKTNWEPGFIEAKHLRIANEGTLALKYQMRIITNGDAGKLADVIDVYYFDEAKQLTRDDFTSAKRLGTLTEVLNPAYAKALSQVISGSLEAGKAKNITLAFKMQESADNEYQELTIGAGFSIQIVATQVAAENDSFDNKYDEGADFDGEISSRESLEVALKNGGLYKLVGDVVLTGAETAKGDADAETVIVLNGHTISSDANYAIYNIGKLTLVGDNAATYSLRSVGNVIYAENYYAIRNEGTLKLVNVKVINGAMNFGDMTVENSEMVNTRSGKHVIYNWDATLTLNNSDFYNENPKNAAIFASKACDVTINGGSFGIADGTGVAGTNWTSCVIDVQGATKLTINNGTFGGSIRNYGSTVTIYDGLFEDVYNSGYNINADSKAYVYGGTFVGASAKKYATNNLATDHVTADNGDGTISVLPKIEGVDNITRHAASGLYWNGNTANHKGVFYIYNASDLQKAASYFVDQTATTEANRATIEIMKNIDMTDVAWNPWNAMWVTINGKGNTISNLTTTAGWKGGFIGAGGSVIINDLTLENVTATGAQVGLFIGGSMGGCQINNCVLKGNNTVSYKEYVGTLNGKPYVEEYGATGVIMGLYGYSNVVDVEIANGAVVNLIETDFLTKLPYGNAMTGYKDYLGEVTETITNNGTINKVSNVYNEAQLNAALKTAIDGTVINLMADISATAPVVIEQPGDSVLNLTIDGNNNSFDGQFKIKGYSTDKHDEALVIKNINFKTETASREFIWSADSSNGSMWRYAHNITIENCTFTASGAAVHTAVGAKFQQTYNIKVVGCTATNMHSLLQAESCGSSVSVSGSKVINGKNGVSFNNTKKASISNTTIESVADGGYGIRHKGEVDNYSLTVENCEISAFIPVLIRNMKAKEGYKATFNGTNTLTATNDFGYQVVLSAGDWDNDSKVPAPATGKYTLTGAEGFFVFDGVITYDAATMGGLYDYLKTLKEGDVLVIPGGTYNTSGSFQLPAGVTIMGKEKETVVFHQNSTGQDEIFQCAGDATFINITFESNRKGYAIADNTKNHDTYGNIKVVDCKFVGIASEKNYGIYKNLYGNLTVENCTFDNYNVGIGGVNNGGDSTTVITGCTFTNINGEAIGYVVDKMPENFEADVIANNTGLTEANVIGY